MAGDEEPTPVEDAPQEGEEVPQEALEGDALEVPPAPKKKPKFFVHWNRRKPRFYDYNWDYGDNYYSSLVKYMDCKGGDVPRRMAFAERGIRSNVLRRTVPDTRTASLLDDVRRSIRNFELSQKTYMKNLCGEVVYTELSFHPPYLPPSHLANPQLFFPNFFAAPTNKTINNLSSPAAVA